MPKSIVTSKSPLAKAVATAARTKAIASFAGLAKALGINPTRLRMILDGKSSIYASTRNRLAKFLGPKLASAIPAPKAKMATAGRSAKKVPNQPQRRQLSGSSKADPRLVRRVRALEKGLAAVAAALLKGRGTSLNRGLRPFLK